MESWKQRRAALSSTEAVYMAMVEATKEAIYLRNLVMELDLRELMDIIVFNDNIGAKLSEYLIFHGRTKQTYIRHHFIRDALKEELFKIKHISTNQMMSGMLTKSLP